MKVAVSASGSDLDASIDPRFGRCAYFVIVETDDMSFEVCDNEGIALGGGAGIQAAQFVASKGAQAVITGNCGPNAVRTLSAAGVTLFVGQSGTVRQAVDDHKMGKLLSTTEANVTDHFGMGGNASPSGEPMASGGSGFGMGRGMGRGGGTGRGGGMGRGMGCRRDVGAQGGMGRWPAPGSSVGAPLSKEEQIRHLRDEAAALRRQIEGLEASIEKLEQD